MAPLTELPIAEFCELIRLQDPDLSCSLWSFGCSVGFPVLNYSNIGEFWGTLIKNSVLCVC